MQKKEVMRKAWEIARNGQKKFGGKVKEYFAMALKLAWKEVKKVTVKLVGTAKQIAWAEDIRNRVISKMEAVIDELNNDELMKKPVRARFFEQYLNHFEMLKNVADAKLWIELFGYAKLHTEVVSAFKRYMQKNGDEKTSQIIDRDFKAAQKLDYETTR